MASSMTFIEVDLFCTHPRGNGGLFAHFTAVYSISPSLRENTQTLEQTGAQRCY